MCDCIRCEQRQERRARLERLRDHVRLFNLRAFMAQDLAWMVPLINGYPDDQRISDERLHELELRFRP